MDAFFHIISYTLPLVLLAIIVKRNPTYRRMAILLALAAPLAGELTYLLSVNERSLWVIAEFSFWLRAAAFYPMAVLPLGIWAAALGGIGAGVIERMSLPARSASSALNVGGLVIGALVGVAFMAGFLWAARAVDAASELRDGVLPYALAGLIAGGCSGLIVTSTLTHSQSVRPDRA